MIKGFLKVRNINKNERIDLKDCVGFSLENMGNGDVEIENLGVVLKPKMKYSVPSSIVVKDISLVLKFKNPSVLHIISEHINPCK